MQRVGSEVVTGAGALHQLLMMMQEAAAPTRLSMRPWATHEFIGWLVSGRQFLWGIYYSRPEALSFETYEEVVPAHFEAIRIPHGRLILDSSRLEGRKWVAELELQDPDVKFFELDFEGQLDCLFSFLLSCLSTLNKMEINPD